VSAPRVGGGGATTPAVKLNSIFFAKMDPRENPEKNAGKREILYSVTIKMTCIIGKHKKTQIRLL
jgi:hypothetical protein